MAAQRKNGPDLEEPARRGARQRDEERARDLLAKAKKSEEKDDQARKMVQNAMAPRWHTAVFVLAVLVVPIAAGVAVIVATQSFLLMIATLLACTVIAFLSMLRLTRTSAERSGQKWLDRLPFDFDRRAYVDLLSREHTFSEQLVAWLQFRQPPPAEDRALLTDATRALLPQSTARWDGDDLVVVSPALETRFSAKGGSYHNNAQLHRWFKRVADKLVPALAERAPVAGILLDIKR